MITFEIVTFPFFSLSLSRYEKNSLLSAKCLLMHSTFADVWRKWNRSTDSSIFFLFFILVVSCICLVHMDPERTFVLVFFVADWIWYTQQKPNIYVYTLTRECPQAKHQSYKWMCVIETNTFTPPPSPFVHKYSRWLRSISFYAWTILFFCCSLGFEHFFVVCSAKCDLNFVFVLSFSSYPTSKSAREHIHTPATTVFHNIDFDCYERN